MRIESIYIFTENSRDSDLLPLEEIKQNPTHSPWEKDGLLTGEFMGLQVDDRLNISCGTLHHLGDRFSTYELHLHQKTYFRRGWNKSYQVCLVDKDVVL